MLSLSSGTQALVPAGNAETKLFRAMDLSDMSKSYRYLEIIRTGIHVY